MIAVVIFATGSDGGSSVADSSFIPEAERVKAPTAPAPLLTGDGERSLTAYRGKVTVLNFWASWCGPCRAEQPELNAAHDKLGNRDVAFLGVDLQDSRTNGQAHWREFDVPYDSLFDRSNSWSARFDGVGPAAIPTTIVLDREGRVAARLFGQTTEGEVLGVTTRILEER